MQPKLLRKPNLTPPPLLKKSARPPSNWGLYESDGYPTWGISYSHLSKLIVCKERGRLRLVEGLVPSERREALEFGTIFHKALELHAQGKTYTQILAYFRKASRLSGGENQLLYQIAVTMIPYYTSFWSKVLDNLNYIESEQVFELPFTCSLQRTIVVRGKRDEGFQRNSKIWLQENKTMSQIREDQILQTLHAMLQPMMYLMSFLHDHPGKPIGGILYNCIRRPNLVQGKKESDKAFLERIAKDIESRPEHYFKMFEVPIDEVQVREWITKYFDPLICQVVIWWESIRHNPLEPWTTPAKNLPASILEGMDVDPEELVPNPYHYIRPFGIFDPLSIGIGDYFSRIVQGHDQGLERIDKTFPELQDE